MKKTLVALAVLAAAGSVNAAEIYSNDGVSTTLSGVAEVQFIDNEGFEDADMAVRLDDFDLTAATTVALSEDLSAIAEVSLGQDRDTTAVSTDRTYVGFASAEMGTLTVGNQTTITDDLGNDASYEFGYALISTNVMDKGTDVVKYTYDNGEVFGAVASDLKESDVDNETLDGRIGVRADALEVALYAGKRDDNTTADGKIDETYFNLQGNYAVDEALALAASFGIVDDSVANAKTTYIQANASYTIDATTYALGVNSADSDKANTDAEYGVYANVTTKLAPSVKVYAEIGYADANAQNVKAGVKEDFGYVAGMEVKF